MSDENWPVEIVPGATLREEDGLAMSSRNLRLDASQRESAKEIHAIITNWIQSKAYTSTTPADGKTELINAINGVAHLEVEYIEFSQAETLVPVNSLI